MVKRLSILTAVLAAIELVSGTLLAATVISVTSTADAGPGSLRQAILDLNVTGGGTVVFSNLSGPIVVSGLLPPLEGQIEIRGPVGRQSIHFANWASGLIQVQTQATVHVRSVNCGPPSAILNAGNLLVSACDLNYARVTNFGTVVLSNCIAGPSLVVSGSGDTVFSRVTIPPVFSLRGLMVFGGRLRLENCAITNHHFWGGGDGFSGENAKGGGIYAIGSQVSLFDCVVTDNSIRAADGFTSQYGQLGGAGGSALGAGIAVEGSGATLAMTNTLVARNVAMAGTGASASRVISGSGYAVGGVYFDGSNVWCMNSTISSNIAIGGGPVGSGVGLLQVGGNSGIGGMFNDNYSSLQ